MNGIEKYCGRKKTLIERFREWRRKKKYPDAIPLHPIGYRPPVYPKGYKKG